MKLLQALLFAAALVVAGVGPAHAEPISIAILSAVGVSATAGSFAVALTTFALTTAASLGLSLLAKSLAPKPKAGEQLSGIETQVQIGGDVARQIITGTCMARGHLVYHNSYGLNNEGYQRVFVLSDWVSTPAGLKSVVINGKKYAVALQSTVGPKSVFFVTGFGSKLIQIDFYDGTQTAADADLVALANPVGRWDANSILTGLTYAIVTLNYVRDDPLYENGIPEIGFEMMGARLYDWREDSTNGGSGPQRWEDVSTWEWTENPVVILYNYLRGFYLNGERILGMGVPSYDIVHDTFSAAANACDEVVVTTGDPEARYRCATILTAEEGVAHSATLEVLLSTFAGYLYDYAGFYVCQVGVAQSSVRTLTDADLVVGQGVTFAAKRSRSDLVNRLHGQFLDPAIDYQAQSYTAQISEAGVINDGNEELGRQLDLLSVSSRTQAERIARIRLREVRAQATASITVGFQHIDLQAGDWITWNSARFGNRTYRIVERNVDPITRAVALQLNEINAAVYSWTAADEGIAPSIPVRLEPGGRITTVSGFGINAVSILSADGNTEIPAIRFYWNTIEDETIEAVLIQYRRVATPTIVHQAIDRSPTDGSITVTDGVVNATDYEARATIVPNPPRLTTWTVWTNITTTSNFLVQALNEVTELSAELQNQLESIHRTGEGTIQGRLQDIAARIEALANDVATEALTAYDDRKLLTVQVQGTAFAAIDEEKTLRVAADSAEATARTTLAAQVTSGDATNAAAITAEATARASADSAFASSFSSLSTTVGGHTSTLSTYGASINGLQVKYAVTGSVNGTLGGFVLTGVARNDGSGGTFDMLVHVDSFHITNGSSVVPAFSVSSGRVIMPYLLVQNAHIDNLSVNTLKIADNAVNTLYDSGLFTGTTTYVAGAGGVILTLPVAAQAGAWAFINFQYQGFVHAGGGGAHLPIVYITDNFGRTLITKNINAPPNAWGQIEDVFVFDPDCDSNRTYYVNILNQIGIAPGRGLDLRNVRVFAEVRLK
jgi:hypothetical protein